MTMTINSEKSLTLELRVRELISQHQFTFEPLHLLKGSPYIALTGILVSRFLKVHYLSHALNPLYTCFSLILLFSFVVPFFPAPYPFETSFILS